MYIDIHVIQTVPPSNLNRDDTGSPKSAVYGGVRRSRVSSQAWKKATRSAFTKQLDRSDLGVRTKRVVELVADRITQQQPEIESERAVASAELVLRAAGPKIDVPKRRAASEAAAETGVSGYLVFLSQHQVDRLAELALREEKPSAREAKAAFDQEHGIEVGLFGRMVADDAALNVDAAVQVAHAISTHAVVEESDYYTAVDDLSGEDETGAGMIGTIEFNSATLYRYASLNVAGLVANLGGIDAAARAAEAFVKAFVLSMPTGKQNTFANRTVPDAVLVMVRLDQPVNLVGAFEDPVRASDSGLVEESCRRLAAQAEAAAGIVQRPVATYLSCTTPRAASLSALVEQQPFADVVRRVGEHVAQSGAEAGSE